VFGPPRDRREALRVLRAAVEAGVNHIDTAQYYGPGVVNELIHEALHPYPADLAIVSKVAARRDAVGAVLPFDPYLSLFHVSPRFLSSKCDRPTLAEILSRARGSSSRVGKILHAVEHSSGTALL